MDPASISASSAWAQRTQIYEAMRESGDVSFAVEAAVSAAGRVRVEQAEVPKMAALMGTHLKQRLAYLEPPPGWGSDRRFTRQTAASLGTYEMREEAIAKLRHHLGTLAEGVARAEEPRVLALEAGIAETVRTDQVIDEVIGRQGEFLSAG